MRGGITLLIVFAPSLAFAQPEGVVLPELTEFVEAERPPGTTEGAEIIVQIDIDVDGRVTRAEPTVPTGSAFETAALDAVRRFVFTPATRDGEPIAVSIRYRYVFEAAPPPPAEPPPEPSPSPSEPAEPEERAEPAEPEEELEFGATIAVEAPPREPTAHRIDAREAVETAGTMGEVLRGVELMPGVSRPPLNEPALLVRGAGPEDSQVFLAGAPVLLLYHFGGFRSFFNSHLIDDVTLVPGNFSVRYGRALGAIVEARPRDPKNDRWHGFFDLSILDASAAVEGPIGERGSVAVAARRSYVDLFFDAIAGDGSSTVTAPVYWDYQTLATVRVSRRDTLRLRAYGSRDRLKIITDRPADDDPRLRGAIGIDLQFHRLQLEWDKRFDRVRQRISVGAGAMMIDTEIGQLSALSTTGPEVFARSEWRFRANERWSLTGGLDFHYVGASLEYTGEQTGPGTGDPGGFDPTNPGQEVHVDEYINIVRPAAYLELDLRPLPPWSIVVGLRTDYSSDIDSVSVDPRLSTRVDVTDDTVLKAGVGLFSQPPGYENGYAIPGIGNPNIGYARALHTTVGVSQELADDALRLGVDGYAKWLDGLPVAPDDGSEPVVDEGRGRILGTDVYAELRLPSFVARINYSYIRSQRRGESGGLRPFDYDVPHALTVSSTWNVGRGWQLSLAFRATSGNPETPVIGSVYDADSDLYRPVFGELNSARQSPFHRLDLRVQKSWTVRAGRISLYLDLQNAYDARNPEYTVYGYDYRQTTTVSQLPIFPNLGVRGEL